MEKIINVNQLNELLGSDEIIRVQIADASNQHYPNTYEVGIGGVLTIIYNKRGAEDD